MRHRIGILLIVTAALLSVPGFATGDEFVSRAGKGASNPFGRMRPFMVSGQYSGPVAGDIDLGYTKYRVSLDASVYEIGTGSVPQGTVVQDRFLCLMGVRVGSAYVVYSVILRPAGESTLGVGDPSSNVSERQGPSPD